MNDETDFNKVDPKDATIVALTTKLNTLEGKMKSDKDTNTKGGIGNSGGKNMDKLK